MKIISIAEPQTSRKNYPYLAYRSDISKGPVYLCSKDGFILLSSNSDGKLHSYVTIPENLFNPIMGQVTLLNE